MKIEIPEDVLRLWEKYGLHESVRKHCITVAEIAVRIAEEMRKRGVEIDVDTVLRGALLHDIGRAVTHDPFRHFVKSAEILRKEGMDEKIVRIAERHFSAGITAEEAEKIGIEPRDYLPETIEEKVVSFADNLAFGSKQGSFEDFMRRLDEIDTENPELRWLTERTRKRAEKMREEIEKLSGMRF